MYAHTPFSCWPALYGHLCWYAIFALDIETGAKYHAPNPVILVGTTQSWLPELIERASKLRVNGGFEKGTDVSVHHILSAFG